MKKGVKKVKENMQKINFFENKEDKRIMKKTNKIDNLFKIFLIIHLLTHSIKYMNNK